VLLLTPCYYVCLCVRKESLVLTVEDWLLSATLSCVTDTVLCRIGKACDLECPTNKAGDACSNHGECVVKDYKAHCNCEGGFLGMSCDAECPGIVEVDGKSAGCNGHGDCLYDAETDSATCQCIEGDGWLGEGCQKECKRGKDDQGNEDSVCSGHGKCALTDDDDAECQCDSLFTGAACNVNCPTNVSCATLLDSWVDSRSTVGAWISVQWPR
jgi:hypothetical protein